MPYPYIVNHHKGEKRGGMCILKIIYVKYILNR